jgi:hypothetical protein
MRASTVDLLARGANRATRCAAAIVSGVPGDHENYHETAVMRIGARASVKRRAPEPLQQGGRGDRSGLVCAHVQQPDRQHEHGDRHDGREGGGQ